MNSFDERDIFPEISAEKIQELQNSLLEKPIVQRLEEALKILSTGKLVLHTNGAPRLHILLEDFLALVCREENQQGVLPSKAPERRYRSYPGQDISTDTLDTFLGRIRPKDSGKNPDKPLQRAAGVNPDAFGSLI